MASSSRQIRRRAVLIGLMGGLLAACGGAGPAPADRRVPRLATPTARASAGPVGMAPEKGDEPAAPAARATTVAISAPVGRAGATALVAAPMRLARLWATDGAPESLALPTALAIGRQGRLYVVDAGNDRIQVFDAAGRSLTRWGGAGTDDGQFRFRRPDRCDDVGDCLPDVAGAVAVDGQERVYVADYGNSRVQAFDADGRLLARWGGEGSGPGELLLPQGIAVGGGGEVYVSDTENHRVQVFDAGGRFLRAWGRMGAAVGALHWPGALAVDGRGEVHVADQGNHRVQVFDPEGRPLRQWEVADSVDGRIERPTGLAVDRQGHVYARGAVGRVLRYDQAGQPLATWEGFTQPTGLAVDEAGDLYVADRWVGRLAKFRILQPMTR
jgi:DNA-binding beta-propeller fold protein YncE